MMFADRFCPFRGIHRPLNREFEMRKLKLDVQNLRVESFAAVAAPEARGGTVHAHNHTRGGHPSCYFSCQLDCTLDMSCNDPCATTGTGLA
jgi:hypothetical protein